MPAAHAGQAQASEPGTGPANLSAKAALLADARLWRAASLGAASSPCLPSGFAALDAELPGGGWPTRMLSELLLAQPGSCEWRLLGPALRALLAGPAAGWARPDPGARRPASSAGIGRPVLLLINPPHAPHLPGLRAHGIVPEQLVWIAPEPGRQQARQSLWATEQAIKANAAAAILAWLPEVRPEQLRRLQAAAQGSQAPVFVLRPLAAQTQSSPAPLRLLLQPGPLWSLQLRILKRRGPAHELRLDLPAVPGGLEQLLAPRLLMAPQAAPALTTERSDDDEHAALARAAAALQ